MPIANNNAQGGTSTRKHTTPTRTLVVVMDGIGLRRSRFGNAYALARKPHLEHLAATALGTQLAAHGTAVGLPSDDDLGNSEVGHNALGAGRIFAQGAKLVQQALDSGSLFTGTAWREVAQAATAPGATLHLLGLLSDGNVHSHENHLHALIRQAKREGVRKIRLHLLLDGRDVGQRSAEIYIERLQQVILTLADTQCDIKVASGGGRMSITMDRYGADWAMVQRGWQAHVLGQAPLSFASLPQAISSLRQDPNLTDQYLPAFVITENGRPVGPIEDGDAVVLFNFRGDRAIEITRAFTEPNFTPFARTRFPKTVFAGMMQYDGDLHLPERYLVNPPLIDQPLSAYLLQFGVRQFACSETQKFGHVTYFWNGNRSGYLDPKLEEYVEIPSDSGITFDQKPEMKAREVADATIERLRKASFDFGRINFANGDMVGHTGVLAAAVAAIEAVDRQLGRILEVAKETGTNLIITADHGNAEEMFDAKEQDYPNWEQAGGSAAIRPKTAHTLSPVPCWFVGPSLASFKLAAIDRPTLSHVANTVLDLMGLPTCPDYLPSLLTKA